MFQSGANRASTPEERTAVMGSVQKPIDEETRQVKIEEPLDTSIGGFSDSSEKT